MDFDVVAVGGATVDLFLLIDSSNPHFKFNGETNELSMHLGDKIVLDNASFMLGGNASNVTVGLKRLGFQSSIVAEIGNDEFSQKIINNLKSEGVDISFLKQTQGQSSFSIILNYQDDRTIFTEKIEKEHDFDFENLSTKWVYLTSLGNKWEEAYRKVSEFVTKSAFNAPKLAFNPGTSQIDAGEQSFFYLFPQTEVLIVNKEEAVKISNFKFQISNFNDMQKLLSELKSLGPKIVVITDGENGSYAMDQNNQMFTQDALIVQVVSKTGAGDAYSTGFLAAIMLGLDVQSAMLWGTKNSASVIGKIGAQTGLLNREDIEI